MVQYIILVIAIQLLFLLVYDFLLKKATFFNYNRAYLIITPLLSFILPLIKLNIFAHTIPQPYTITNLTHKLTNAGVITLEEVTVTATAVTEKEHLFSTHQWLFITGLLISLVLFISKLVRIGQLKKSGTKKKEAKYTEVIVPSSNIAFSFLKSIYLGDQVKAQPHDHIIKHELVHITHKHSLDLIFFEILRIIFWFNPLVYMYQSRITELHEYIADNNTVTTHKKEHYQWMLQEAFQTQDISFINQFFNHSLIKKRIVMLQKSRSKKAELIKYALLIPVVTLMVVYTSSCTQESLVEETPVAEKSIAADDEVLKQQILEEINADLASGKKLTDMLSDEMKKNGTKHKKNKVEYYRFNMLTYTLFIQSDKEGSDTYAQQFYDMSYAEYLKKFESKTFIDYVPDNNDSANPDVPYSVVASKPLFAGCENAANPDACFKEKLDEHVMATFQYPVEAQQAGIQGRVYVNFRINTEGNVELIGVRGPDQTLEDEAQRIVKKLPHFTPGKDANGNPVNITFAYPIVFKLN